MLRGSKNNVSYEGIIQFVLHQTDYSLLQVCAFLLLIIGIACGFPSQYGDDNLVEREAAHGIVKRSPTPQSPFGNLNLQLTETLIGSFGFQFRPDLGFLG